MKIKYQNDNVTIVELPPSLRSVYFTYDKEVEPTIYRLALPYLVFVIGHRIGSDNRWHERYFKVFFRPEPLGSEEDELYQCFLPNTKPDSCDHCLGFNGGVSGGNHEELLERIMAAFFGRCFNRDYFPFADMLKSYLREFSRSPLNANALDDYPNPAAMEEWEKRSQQDKECWRKWWYKKCYTVNDFLNPVIMGEMV